MAFRAVWALTGAYLRLRLFPVRQIRDWAEAQGSGHRNQASVVRAFYRVASRIPATCLTRAFALQRLLSQHGHATELRIGVQRGTESLEC